MREIYDAKTLQPCAGVGYLLTRVRAELVAAIDQELAPLDVTTAQFSILKQLSVKQTDVTSGLCKGLDYDPGAMTRMIDRLEAKKFIRRVRCLNDRRVVNIELTDEGKAAYPAMMERVVGVINRFLRGFSKTEVREFERFLQRMLANA
jgi:DNA-binding MarR family transcriptional regulator